MKLALRFALIEAVLLADISGVAAQEKSWVGEQVQYTKPHTEVKFIARVGDQQMSNVWWASLEPLGIVSPLSSCAHQERDQDTGDAAHWGLRWCAGPLRDRAPSA